MTEELRERKDIDKMIADGRLDQLILFTDICAELYRSCVVFPAFQLELFDYRERIAVHFAGHSSCYSIVNVKAGDISHLGDDPEGFLVCLSGVPSFIDTAVMLCYNVY